MEREAYRDMDAKEATHWWFVARRRIIRSLIDHHARLPPEAQILEAGCGTGGNLGLLASYGEVFAFEYDSEARDAASRKSGLTIPAGTLPYDVPFAGKTFDLIAMFDVLEHIEADKASLAALVDKLSPSGKILITVPAIPWLWSKHDVMHHHKRRYTKAGLERLLDEVGLSEVRIGYFNSLLFPLAVLNRIYRKFSRSQQAASDDVAPILSGIFEKVFSIESIFLQKASFPIGLSLYAVAARN